MMVWIPISAHQAMIYPEPRYTSSTNGIRMGPGSDGPPDFAQENERDYIVKLHPDFYDYPCGGAPISGYTSTLYNQGPNIGSESDKDKFDFSNVTLATKSGTALNAGTELVIQIKGYHHPGVARFAICYEDCMKAANYETFILGYYYHQGLDGTPGGGSIFDALIDIKVKVPMKNCENCVLQYLDDTDDGRSYVSCADISITGGSENADYVECNGHPLCDCTVDSSSSEYGLGKSCATKGLMPLQEDAGPWTWPGSWIEQHGLADFCKFCAFDGCPAACGGKWNSAYVTRRDEPINREPQFASAIATPSYVRCDCDNKCNCPGCSEARWTSCDVNDQITPSPVNDQITPSPVYDDWVLTEGEAIKSGNDLGDPDGESFDKIEECRELCRNDDSCKGITYKLSAGLCWRKSELNLPLFVDADFNTEIKPPPPTPGPTPSPVPVSSASFLIPPFTLLTIAIFLMV